MLAASGETDAARRAIAAVGELFAQLPGFVSQLGESDVLAASIEVEAGHSAAAEPFYRRAIETLEKGEHALWWRAATLGLADVLLDLGRDAEAAALLDDIERRGLTWGGRPRSRYLQARARLAMSAGETEMALRLGREAVEVLTNVNSLQNLAHAHEVLGDLLAEAGDAAGFTVELDACSGSL